VEDIREIMKYHIMSTPALVVNENVEIKGRVPSSSEIRKVLLKYQILSNYETNSTCSRDFGSNADQHFV